MNFHLFIWNPGGESDEETVELDERSSDIKIKKTSKMKMTTKMKHPKKRRGL